MTITANSPTGAGASTSRVADVLVVFGITGDLAKVMTLRSLYRLEARGLLTCPIVGVAVDDWTADDLRERAREAIVDGGESLDPEVFDRFAARLSYMAGDFGDPDDVHAARRRARRREEPGLLPRDPAVPVRHGRRRPGRRGPDRGRARRRREAVRPRPRVRPRARRRAAPAPRRAPAVPDRPLPREDGPQRDPLPALRERDARAGLAPQLGRERADHDGRGLRRRGPRALLRPGRRAARRRRQPPDAGGRRGGDGAAGGARSGHAEERAVRRLPRDAARRPGALRPRPVRRLPRHRRRRGRTRRPRRTRRCGSRSTTGAGPGSRSSSAPASASR